jgi:hypothetical protein
VQAGVMAHSALAMKTKSFLTIPKQFAKSGICM